MRQERRTVRCDLTERLNSERLRRYSLRTGWGSVDLDEPHFKVLVHHEVEPKELEALVGEVLGADGRLHARQAAPGTTQTRVIHHLHPNHRNRERPTAGLAR